MMHSRRDFLKFSALAATACLRLPALAATKPQIAFTIDDVSLRPDPRMDGAQRSRAILDAMDRIGARAALFAVGGNVDSPLGNSVLNDWSAAGHIIGNHTWSHRNYSSSRTDPQEFLADFDRAHSLLEKQKGFRPLFRFPMLKEGATREKRDTMRAHLHKRGYRNGHVTVDTSDWVIAQRLSVRLEKEPQADLAPYQEFHGEHILERATYYHSLAQRAAGREVRHTVLLHFNLATALFAYDLARTLRTAEWEIVDAEQAFGDDIFRREPDIAPCGESLIWQIAKESGRFETELRSPGEDDSYEIPKMDARKL